MGTLRQAEISKYQWLILAVVLLIVSLVGVGLCFFSESCFQNHYPNVTHVRGPDVASVNTGRAWHLWREDFFTTADAPGEVRAWYDHAGWESSNSGASWVSKMEFFCMLSVSRQAAVIVTEDGLTIVMFKSAIVVKYPKSLFLRTC